MYGYSNLPPGCSVSDIPGNRAIDEWGEQVAELIDEEAWNEMVERTWIGRKLESLEEEYGLEDDPEYVAGMINDLYVKLKEQEEEGEE